MKTIVFDFDGTLTKKNNEIWRNIWIKLDATDVDDILYSKFNDGDLNYDEWSREIEKEFIKRKFNKDLLLELTSNIELMDNVENCLKELKKEGYDLRILSGGIDFVIKTLLKDSVKYFSDIRCNEFVFDDNGYLTKIIDTDSDGRGKQRYVNSIIKETKCDPKDIIFVGNGNNDRFVSSTGCTTICINPNNTDHKDKNIWSLYIKDSNDLNDVLNLVKQLQTKKATKK